MAKLSEFVKQVKKDDWTLDDDTGEALVIVRQPGEKAMQAMAEEWPEDEGERGKLFLRTVAGDAYDDLMAITEDAPAGTRDVVFSDLIEHFGLGNF